MLDDTQEIVRDLYRQIERLKAKARHAQDRELAANTRAKVYKQMYHSQHGELKCLRAKKGVTLYESDAAAHVACAEFRTIAGMTYKPKQVWIVEQDCTPEYLSEVFRRYPSQPASGQ